MSYLFDDEAALCGIATAAVERARLAGMEARAIAESGGGAQVTVRGGEVDTATRDGHQSLTITVFADGRTGSATTATLAREAIDRAVDEAMTIARLVQPDADAGLADPDWLATGGADVVLFASDPAGPAGLLDAAFEIEGAARSDDWRVTGAGATSSDGVWALATSTGFARASRHSHQSRWCEVMAPDGDASVMDYCSSDDRRVEALMAPDAIARTAIDRALAGRGARTVASRRVPVLFEPRVAAILLGELVGALSGGPQYAGSTFLPDPIGRAVAADHVDLDEDPFEPFGLASGPFDGEGVAGTTRRVVDAGEARGLFLAARSARRLGMRSTGNGNGPYNLRLSSRTPAGDRDALLARMGTGLVVTHLLGGATEPVSGRWTRAVAGHWVEGGAIAYPVRDVTLAGAMPAMLRGIVAIDDAVERFGAFRTGAILIDDMQVGGTG